MHDDTIKVALKTGKAPEDCCDIGFLKLSIDAMAELGQSEKKQSEPEQPAGESKKDAAAKDAMKQEMTAVDMMIVKIKAASGEAAVGEEKIDQVKDSDARVKRLMSANVKFMTLPTSEKQVREAMTESAAGRVRGEENKNFVGIFFDPAQFGETVTAPHIRVNAVNQTTLKVQTCTPRAQLIRHQKPHSDLKFDFEFC